MVNIQIPLNRKKKKKTYKGFNCLQTLILACKIILCFQPKCYCRVLLKPSTWPDVPLATDIIGAEESSLCLYPRCNQSLNAFLNQRLLCSLVVQMVKNLPAIQKAWVQSLDGEDSLEKEMATHSSILAWEIPWTEEPGGL